MTHSEEKQDSRHAEVRYLLSVYLFSSPQENYVNFILCACSSFCEAQMDRKGQSLAFPCEKVQQLPGNSGNCKTSHQKIHSCVILLLMVCQRY